MAMPPHIGQRVILNHLLHEGDYPGIIVAISPHDVSPYNSVCVVKLDHQKEPVRSVIYYDERPTVVHSTLWQICYPLDNHKG